MSQLCFKVKKNLFRKFNHRQHEHKTSFGMKMILNFLHEPKVLLVSLAHFLTHMTGLMQNVQEKPTHTLQTTIPQFPQRETWAWAFQKTKKKYIYIYIYKIIILELDSQRCQAWLN